MLARPFRRAQTQSSACFDWKFWKLARRSANLLRQKLVASYLTDGACRKLVLVEREAFPKGDLLER